MVNNELVLLDQVLKQRQDERSTPIKDDDAFELFACEQALGERDLSTEEVADGVVGGGNDGGLDGVYVFLGDVLLAEDSDVFQDDFVPGKIAARSRLELWLVQAKRETSFSESAIEKVADSCRRLLSLAEQDADLEQLYSTAVVTRTGFFRRALQVLAARHPQVAIRFVYATRGRVDSVNTKVEIKARDLRRQFDEVVSGAFICGVFGRSTGSVWSGRSWVDKLKPSGKSFDISKWEVWEAYRQVKANRGAPGVDGVTLEVFEKGSMWRFAATLRKGGGEGPNLHLLHSTMSESPYLQTELPSTFVAHVGSQTRCPILN